MFIEFQLPQDGVEGDIVAFDEEGNKVKVSRIVYRPYFFKPSSVPVVMFASLFGGNPSEKKASDKSAKQRSVLTVSGTKATLKFQDRTEHVTPLCEEPDKDETKEPARGSTSRKSSSS
jgi:hypothetical protein